MIHSRVSGLLRPSVLAATLSLLTVEQSFGAPNDNAKILLHLGSVANAKIACSQDGLSACADIVTRGQLYPHKYFAYVLVADAEASAGLAGVQFGLSYNGKKEAGVDIYSWHRCTDIDMPTLEWPNSGSGTMLAWREAKRTEPEGEGLGVMAVAGYFYCAAYSPDELRISTHPLANASVLDGSGNESELTTTEDSSLFGSISFSADGNSEGTNPCGYGVLGRNMVSAQPATEGALRSNLNLAVSNRGHAVQFGFSLQVQEHVNLSILEVTGRVVKQVASQDLTAGEHVLVWDTRNVNGEASIAAGMYFYRLETGTHTSVGKIVIGR